MKSLFKVEMDTILINQKEVLCELKTYIHDDFDAELDWNFEPGEKEKLELQLSNGDIRFVGVEVIASALDEQGRDSIWGVLVKSDDDVADTVKEYGMKTTAKLELARAIHAKCKLLKPFI